jgi:hypothetical protein
MTKYTSAPWVVRNSQNRKGIIEIEAGVESDSINHGVPICDVRIVNLPERKKQAKQNAHLIAAAPELLEAIQFALEYSAPSEEMWNNFKTLAKKAIAKAKGEDV